MSRTERFRPTRFTLVIGAMIGALALTGCGAGQISQTAEQTAAVSGANVTAGDIAVRNAMITFPSGVKPERVIYPSGGSAPVTVVIANSSDIPDKLLSASSPIASSVQLAGETTVPGEQTLVSGGDGTKLSNSRQLEITLEGLTGDIRPGLTYPLVLVFERAGAITVDLPVDSSEAARRTEGSGGGGSH
ncbi:copper chaperone PCu(A)C [Pseudonocardia asaccharolytica]|uniref:Putative lipoprotein lpqE n=1 Tax=Pseudonocardia asaccharolytica DSM 44247 = NBRC 16224 TaxID=1123024 RepID=A0A511D3F2_9PSEU|nr:copper chaperone PCu(A)C [Pseudonocardia asaccharolytica]GEL17438.1 putative lipoprotein lpqE precursor [Pseudonocardia asaccharolytica DSM 44247 = NBRC 16224]